MKKLEIMGYVRKILDSEDRRAWKVYLTKKAKIIEGEIFSILSELTGIIIDGFDAKEVDIFRWLLLRAKNNISNKIKEGGTNH